MTELPSNHPAHRDTEPMQVVITTVEGVVMFAGRITQEDEFHLEAERGQVPRVRLTAMGEGAFAVTGIADDAPGDQA